MPDAVKPKRPYESPRRREQAERTRLDILRAAQRLFERDGYAPTTMAAIAAEARVALKTVYVAFDTKSGVLRALWNHLLRGPDQEQVPVARQAWYREVLEEPDAGRQLRLNARNSATGKRRIGALAQVVRGAAEVDAEAAELWARIQTEYHANQRAIVTSVAEKNALREELDVDTATDMLWTVNHPDTWRLLVLERGWSDERYEAWTAELACRELLRAPDPSS